MNDQVDMDILFEDVFKKLSSPQFGKNLGGELPLFIQPIPISGQTDLNAQVKRLQDRLRKKHLNTIVIDLYDMATGLLKDEGVLDTILEEESNIPREDILSTFDSLLDIKTVIIPYMQEKIKANNPDFVFITGVGRVYPFIRSHGILNNIEELASSNNLVLFFPGEYNNLQLSLFKIISDENYYRGHNLNEILLTKVTI